MKFLLVILGIVTGLSCHPGMPRFGTIDSSAASILEGIRNEGIIVRVATQGRKIKYYKQRLSNPGISEAQREDFEKLLTKAQEEDQTYVRILREGIASKYTFSNVCFIPDTIFKRFLNGHEGRCMQIEGESSPFWPEDRRAMLAAKNDRDDLVFVTTTGERLPEPLPHKKYIWFPVFRKIFQREKYIEDQIDWFQKQFENQYITTQIQLKKL
jgi:hypothetical protein